MNKIDSTVSFDPTILNVIDTYRGRMTRSAYINTVFRELFSDDVSILIEVDN